MIVSAIPRVQEITSKIFCRIVKKGVPMKKEQATGSDSPAPDGAGRKLKVGCDDGAGGEN